MVEKIIEVCKDITGVESLEGRTKAITDTVAFIAYESPKYSYNYNQVANLLNRPVSNIKAAEKRFKRLLDDEATNAIEWHKHFLLYSKSPKLTNKIKSIVSKYIEDAPLDLIKEIKDMCIEYRKI